MKKIFSILAASMLAMSMWAGELTVADGTVENSKLPVNGYYCDVQSNRTQFVYSAEDLVSMAGASISSLTFYSKNETLAWGAAEFVVKVAEVEQSSLSGFLDATFTQVYAGKLSIASSFLEIEFATTFAYTGKNLLVDISQTVASSYKDALEPTFYGVAVDGAGYGNKAGQYGAAGVVNFLPKVSIGYEGGAVVNCPRPTKLTVSATTADGAVLAWQAEAGAQHQVCVVEKDAEAAGWQLLDTDVLTYTATGLTAGTTYDFYVRTYCSESEQSTEVKTSFTPECKAPAAIELSNLTHAAATFSWEAVAGIEKYQFVCVLPDSTPTWAGVEAKAVLSFSVDTLQPNTAYNVYVRSYFSAETQSPATKLSFRTNCEAETMPYSEDFSDADRLGCWVLGSKWTRNTGNEDHTTGGYTGTLRYDKGAASDALSVSIELSEPAILSFYYKNKYQYSGIPFDVTIIDASNESELLSENIATSSGEGWGQKEIDLSAYTGKNIKIKFSCSNNNSYILIDDISVTYKPCPAPTNLAAEATADGANVTWESAEGASWNLRYRESEAEPEANWTIVANLTEKSLTLEGLTEGTTYEVQVQAVASTHRVSEWSASATFTPTACADVTKVSFADATYNSVDVAWTATGAGIWELRYKAGEGEWTTVSDIAETHHVLTGLTTNAVYSIEVKAACGDASTWVAAAKTFTPVYSAPVAGEAETITDLGATVQWLGVTDADTYEYDFVLPGAAAAWKQTTALTATADDLLAGTDYLFVVRTKYPTGVSETDTTEFATITIAPKNLAQEGEATVSSAVFTWEANGAATQWQWRVDNGAWSEPISVLTATADELEAGTAFTFYVRSYYSATVQSAAISLAFQTACAEKEVGFSESFESGVPACWESTGSWNTTTEFFHRGNAIRINARNASGSLTTPTINIDTDNAVLIFYQRNQYGGGNYVAAKVIITPAGEEATEIGFVNAADLTKQVIALSAFESKKVTIQFSIPNTGASSSAYVYIDEVQVVETCDAPTDLAVQTDETGATITWTAGSGAQQLRYKSTAADDWTTINDATSPYVLTELDEDADYAVQVRSVCSEENASDWSATVSFSTSAGTGIATIHTDTDAVKRLEDGRLVIISNGVKYNAQGTILK